MPQSTPCWQTLTASPYTVPPVDPTISTPIVIILLTDGLNTQDRWYTDQNSRQQLTCDNAKAAGIVLYMIQVNTGRRSDVELVAELRQRPPEVLPADVGRPGNVRHHRY